ncbi:MAG: hypothetical protein GX491_01725 [Chloroflexi bacterium]|nr:hypothetical protein [Chloroflexota bacterium]
MEQQGIVKGDDYQKLGSIGFILAGVLIIIGNVWVAAIDLSDPAAAQDKFLNQLGILNTVSLMLTFGWFALLAGALAVRRSITQAGAAWATLGVYILTAGAAIWTVGMSLDISYSALMANWLAAPEAGKEAAYSLINTLFPPGLGFGRGLFPLEILVNWLAIACLSLGMLRSCLYPRWLCLYGLILGVSGVVAGVIMTYTGREAIFTPFTALAFATIAWVFLCGIWMAKKAW